MVLQNQYGVCSAHHEWHICCSRWGAFPVTFRNELRRVTKDLKAGNTVQGLKENLVWMSDVNLTVGWCNTLYFHWGAEYRTIWCCFMSEKWRNYSDTNHVMISSSDYLMIICCGGKMDQLLWWGYQKPMCWFTLLKKRRASCYTRLDFFSTLSRLLVDWKTDVLAGHVSSRGSLQNDIVV